MERSVQADSVCSFPSLFPEGEGVCPTCALKSSSLHPVSPKGVCVLSQLCVKCSDSIGNFPRHTSQTSHRGMSVIHYLQFDVHSHLML